MASFIPNSELLFIDSDSDNNPYSTQKQLNTGKLPSSQKPTIHGNYRIDSACSKIRPNIMNLQYDQYEYQFQSPRKSENRQKQRKIRTTTDEETTKVQRRSEQEQNKAVDEQIVDYNAFTTRTTPSILLKFEIESQDDEIPPLNSIPKKDLTIDKIPKIQQKNNQLLQFKSMPISFPHKKKYFQPVTSKSFLQISKNQFARNVIEEGKVLEAKIAVSSTGLDILYPHFDMLFYQDATHILTSKKQTGSLKPNYYISTHPKQCQKRNQFYIGKIRSAKSSNVFNIFQKIGKSKASQKCLVASIFIDSRATTRKMVVYMLKNVLGYYSLRYYSKNKDTSLDYLYQIEQNKKLIDVFTNKEPRFSMTEKRFILDFHGKVKQPSLSNFILQNQNNDEVMLFGKIGPNEHFLEVKSPFSAWMAMAICTAQLQTG